MSAAAYSKCCHYLHPHRPEAGCIACPPRRACPRGRPEAEPGVFEDRPEPRECNLYFYYPYIYLYRVRVLVSPLGGMLRFHTSLQFRCLLRSGSGRPLYFYWLRLLLPSGSGPPVGDTSNTPKRIRNQANISHCAATRLIRHCSFPNALRVGSPALALRLPARLDTDTLAPGDGRCESGFAAFYSQASRTPARHDSRRVARVLGTGRGSAHSAVRLAPHSR